MRKIIASRLTESKATVPHFYAAIECELDAALALRKTLKLHHATNISVNDLVIRCAGLALRDVPEVNAQWDPINRVVQNNASIDIAIAVATPSGLITPIVPQVPQKGLGEINATVKDLASRAREGKLKPEEYQGGSFTISNLGMFGIDEFSAVINPPQACIMAVGGGVRKVVNPEFVDDGRARSEQPRPRVATVMTATLSCDRRVVDDAIAAQYLQAFQSYLSQPHLLNM
jgi:pyruvate dehydrogenase E2 component (dihydrolipoamide acetyltransferase)